MKLSGMLLPLLLLLLQAAPEEADEWVRDVPNLFEGSWFLAGTEAATHLVARVVDDATGEPIAGARLCKQWEEGHALPRLVAPGRVSVSGADGWVRYALEPYEGPWTYVEADGYGPWADLSDALSEIRLRRGVDLHVRLRDWSGRPVAGAHLGYYLGCGHTPDSRQAVTDAEGRAVIPCVDPMEGILFPVGEGIEARDWFGCGFPTVDGEIEMVCSPGQTIRGVIHDAQGEPIAGAMLERYGWNHGPRTRADAEGRFRLQGVWHDARVDVIVDDECVGSFEVHPGESRDMFSLARPPYDVHTQMLDVTLFEAGAEELEEEVAALAVHDDGRRFDDRTDFDGEVRLTLPPGGYTVWIGARLGAYRRTSVRVTVPRDERPEPMRVEVERNPVLPVDASAVPEYWAVVLACALEERDVTELARAGRVPVPDGVACVLRVECGDQFGGLVRVPADHARVVLPAPPPLPGEPEELPPREVRVLLADGTPAVGAGIRWRGPYGHQWDYADDDGVVRIGFECGTLDIDSGAPSSVVHRVGLAGDGPWNVRLPAGTVELDVRDVDGAPVEGSLVLLDGVDYRGTGLRGLAAGPHRVLVAAQGFLAKDCRIVLKEAETRRLELRLARAPG